MNLRKRLRGQAGTSSLEVVGLIGMCLFMVMVLIQGGLALYAYSASETAARQAARAYSLNSDPHAAAAASLPGWLSHDVDTFGPDHGVSITSAVPKVVPGFELTVTREAEMP